MNLVWADGDECSTYQMVKIEARFQAVVSDSDEMAWMFTKIWIGDSWISPLCDKAGPVEVLSPAASPASRM